MIDCPTCGEPVFELALRWRWMRLLRWLGLAKPRRGAVTLLRDGGADSPSILSNVRVIDMQPLLELSIVDGTFQAMLEKIEAKQHELGTDTRLYWNEDELLPRVDGNLWGVWGWVE